MNSSVTKRELLRVLSLKNEAVLSVLIKELSFLTKSGSFLLRLKSGCFECSKVKKLSG